MHLPSPIARCRRSTLGVVIGVVVLGCNIQEGALREEPPPNGSAEFCAENQHVEDHACVACPEGLVNAAGDDPSGDDTACSERLGLGAACTESDACDSAHCVDGVCCESACDGPCMDCGEAGLCDVTLEDDDACGQISCLVGAEECRLYTPAITSQRCLGFGECKTTDDCTVEHQPRGTQCALGESPYSVCVEGECSYPSVECGDETCAVGSGDNAFPIACCNLDGVLWCGHTCAAPLSGTNIETPMFCDEHEDCRPGHRCALLSLLDGRFRIFCTDDPDYDGETIDHYEVCDSPVMDPAECTNGAPCNITYPQFEGWAFCSHD